MSSPNPTAGLDKKAADYVALLSRVSSVLEAYYNELARNTNKAKEPIPDEVEDMLRQAIEQVNEVSPLQDTAFSFCQIGFDLYSAFKWGQSDGDVWCEQLEITPNALTVIAMQFLFLCAYQGGQFPLLPSIDQVGEFASVGADKRAADLGLRKVGPEFFQKTMMPAAEFGLLITAMRDSCFGSLDTTHWNYDRAGQAFRDVRFTRYIRDKIVEKLDDSTECYQLLDKDKVLAIVIQFRNILALLQHIRLKSRPNVDIIMSAYKIRRSQSGDVDSDPDDNNDDDEVDKLAEEMEHLSTSRPKLPCPNLDTITTLVENVVLDHLYHWDYSACEHIGTQRETWELIPENERTGNEQF